MSRMKKGNGLLRFLVFAALFALVLTGCNGARKYEAVDLSSETAAGAGMVQTWRQKARIQELPDPGMRTRRRSEKLPGNR